ncbi:hypothetical protein AB0I49_07020 [Streptomyces sp. NPDC050617]|uniref:hypothetical protein n=1 Tax=Streptomyces sp. NPDC050617 TaxID=3154628 RepID=UPI0034320410
MTARHNSPYALLAGFALLLAAMFGVAYAVGSAVGPVAPGMHGSGGSGSGGSGGGMDGMQNMGAPIPEAAR